MPDTPQSSPEIKPPNESNLDEWDVLVGRISGTWDRANLKVQPFSPSPERFAVGSQLCAATKSGRRLLTIQSSRSSGHSFIVDCGLKTTPEAESFKGVELFIHHTMRAPLPEGEFYIDEMLGMRVETESGDDWGEIEEILETPAHDVYVTPHAMIPSAGDFVVHRNWEKRVVIVREIPGMRTDDPQPNQKSRSEERRNDA